jgi:heme/copper-type cytochrome/quinol oxidase subunit 3
MEMPVARSGFADESMLAAAARPRATARAVPAARRRTAVSNARVGVVMLVCAEAMFFAGLMSALFILRAGAAAWPPPDQPRLPVAVTGANTLVLLLSGYCMQRALAASRGNVAESLRWLIGAASLGMSFLVVQGTEWVRLVGYGLYATSGIYGGTFYTLIGAHGVHVLAGVLIVLAVLRRIRGGVSDDRKRSALEACHVYWQFVVGVWPLLYVLVYLV